jgi:glycosyltransferase involved in cell wall biosynthesis
VALTFSIITCTWNSAAYLDACIASVLAQEDAHVEMIFVDGGSTDATLEKIRAIPRPVKLLENIRGGISRAMNEGIRIASGEFVAHLHSDDYYLRADVLSCVAAHLTQSGRDWLFGRIMRDVNGALLPEGFKAPDYSFARLLRRNFIPHPATFVRRTRLNELHGFDTGLQYAMDYDMWLRLGRKTEPVQLNTPLAAFRVHEGSLSTRHHLAAMEEDFKVRLRHIHRNPATRAMHYTRYLARRRQAMRTEREAGVQT